MYITYTYTFKRTSQSVPAKGRLPVLTATRMVLRRLLASWCCTAAEAEPARSVSSFCAYIRVDAGRYVDAGRCTGPPPSYISVSAPPAASALALLYQ